VQILAGQKHVPLTAVTRDDPAHAVPHPDDTRWVSGMERLRRCMPNLDQSVIENFARDRCSRDDDVAAQGGRLTSRRLQRGAERVVSRA